MEHNYEEEKRFIILRVIISLIFFGLGFLYPILFILAYFIAGYDIIWRAIKNIINLELFDENFLMSVATIGALCIKEYPEAVMVMVLYQIGEYLQDKAIHKSKKSINDLINFRPEYAVVNGRRMQPENVEIGEVVTVNTGEKIPLDGIVVEGSALIDNSMLTGESIPIYAEVGKEVLSGGINLNSVLKIKVTKKYEQSTVHKIIQLIESSAEKKAKTEKFITKFAKIYTPIVVLIALVLALALPALLNIGYAEAIKRALTFLVISCPCALIISIPLTFFAGIGGASNNGILIKGGNYLEQLSKIGTIVFDKTGTLTTGIFGIRDINSCDSDILKYAAIAESASSHPLAIAIKNAYKNEIPETTEILEDAGNGVKALWEGKTIKAGTAKYVGVEPINTLGTVIYVSIDDSYIGNIVLADVIREDSEKTIRTLHNMKIKTVMLTGDTIERAETLKNILNIQTAYAELLPSDKVSKTEGLMQTTQLPLAFVGDGINDAPVLKRADVGIAMGGIGSDAAIEASDVVLMEDKPYRIITAVKIARKTMSIVKQNIFFALGIKTMFLILGGFGYMTMWGAVFADVGVALIAILNALRAKNIK